MFLLSTADGRDMSSIAEFQANQLFGAILSRMPDILVILVSLLYAYSYVISYILAKNSIFKTVRFYILYLISYNI